MTGSGAAARRDYGGQTASARTEARRAKLVEAGLELFGTVGVRGTSVRGVLRESGVGERYFYESFDSVEDLLIAVGVEVQRKVKDAVLESLATLEDPTIIDMCRAGLLAMAVSLTEDPRFLRVAMVETIGVSEKVTTSRSELIDWFVDLVVASTVANGPIPPASARIFALALVGAANEVLVRWAAGTVPVDMPTVVEHLLVLFWGTLEYAEALCVVAEPS